MLQVVSLSIRLRVDVYFVIHGLEAELFIEIDGLETITALPNRAMILQKYIPYNGIIFS